MHPDAGLLQPGSRDSLLRASPQEGFLVGRNLHHNLLLPTLGTASEHPTQNANSVVAPDTELECSAWLHPVAQVERTAPHVVRVERKDLVSGKNSGL